MLRKMLGGIILIALILIVPYITVKYLIFPYWRFLLFYVYLLGISIMFLGGFLSVAKLRKSVGNSLNRTTVMVECFRVIQKTTRLGRIRKGITGIFSLIHETLLWPSVIPLNINSTAIGVNHLTGLSKIHPPENIDTYAKSPNYFFNLVLLSESSSVSALFDSLVLMLNISVVYLVNHLYSPPWEYSVIFLIFMQIHVVARHLSYVTCSVGITKILKIKDRNPYLSYLTIVALDFSAIVLAFAIIAAVKNETFVTFENVKEVVNHLLMFKQFGNLLHINELKPFEIWLGVVGIVFYIALLRLLMRFGSFKRGAEDFRVFAVRHMLLGEFTTAMQYLQKIKELKRLEIEDLRQIVMCYMCQKQTDKAFSTAESYLKESKALVGADDVFSFVTESISMLDISEGLLMEAMKKGVEMKVTDSRMLATIWWSNVKFGTGDNEDGYISRLETFFLENSLMEKYPLSFKKILIERKQPLRVLKELLYLEQKKDIDRIMRSILNILALFEYEDMRLERNLPMGLCKYFGPPIIELNIQNIVSTANKLVNKWEITFVITIMKALAIVLPDYSPGKQEAWNQTIDKLKTDVADDEEMTAKVHLVENIMKKRLFTVCG